jgi:hypothetical protein
MELRGGHRAQHRSYPLELCGSAADHRGDRGSLGHGHAARHRRIDDFEPRQGGEFADNLGTDRAHHDVQVAGRDPAQPVDDQCAGDRTVGQHADRQLGGGQRFRGIDQRHRTRSLIGHRIVGVNGMSGRSQVRGHGPTHAAQAGESDQHVKPCSARLATANPTVVAGGRCSRIGRGCACSEDTGLLRRR